MTYRYDAIIDIRVYSNIYDDAYELRGSSVPQMAN